MDSSDIAPLLPPTSASHHLSQPTTVATAAAVDSSATIVTTTEPRMKLASSASSNIPKYTPTSTTVDGRTNRAATTLDSAHPDVDAELRTNGNLLYFGMSNGSTNNGTLSSFALRKTSTDSGIPTLLSYQKIGTNGTSATSSTSRVAPVKETNLEVKSSAIPKSTTLNGHTNGTDKVSEMERTDVSRTPALCPNCNVME